MLSTKKEVKEKIRAYILSYYDDATNWGDKTPAEALRVQMEAVKDGRQVITDYQAGAKLAEAGNYAFYTDDMRQALIDWLGDDGKSHNDSQVWRWYFHLIGRESEAIVKSLKKGQA